MNRVCSIDGCSRIPEPYKTICSMHRSRLRRWGSFGDDDPRRLVRASGIERFVNRIEVSPSGCWLWQGATYRDGYGVFRVGGVHVRAHRWAYRRYVKAIPPTLHIDHLCSVKTCVNPDHLEAVTTQENTRRWKARTGSGPNRKEAECSAPSLPSSSRSSSR